MSRRGLARDRAVWSVIAASFLFYALVGAGIQLWAPELGGPLLPGAIAAGALFAIVVAVSRPPSIDGWQSHVIAASSYVMPVLPLVACAPHASWAVPTAGFAGWLIPTRERRWKMIFRHLYAATAIFGGLIVSGRLDTFTVLALLTLLFATWVLAVAVGTVWKASEAQGRAIDELQVRDPLTGTGTRRLLRDRLIEELPRHTTMQMPLTVIDLSLAGYQELKARDGRGATQQLLRDLAVLLEDAAGPRATVARVGGAGHFQVLLPLVPGDELPELLHEIRRAVAGMRADRPIGAHIGVATFPEDGVSADALLEAADERRRADDLDAHDLSSPVPRFDPFELAGSRLVARQWLPPAQDEPTGRRRAGT